MFWAAIFNFGKVYLGTINGNIDSNVYTDFYRNRLFQRSDKYIPQVSYYNRIMLLHIHQGKLEHF